MSGEGAAYLLEKAWVDGAVRDDVRVEIVDGRFTSVQVGRENSCLDEKVFSSKHEFHRPAGETGAPGLPELAAHLGGDGGAVCLALHLWRHHAHDLAHGFGAGTGDPELLHGGGDHSIDLLG